MDKEVELILTKLRIVSEEKERGMYLCDKEHSKLLLDYITNLQESEAYYYGQYKDYKLRNEKANWWLEEMLKQEKSDETKAIINGTLELLLNGGDEE